MCDSACYFTRRQCVKALRILSTPWFYLYHSSRKKCQGFSPNFSWYCRNGMYYFASYQFSGKSNNLIFALSMKKYLIFWQTDKETHKFEQKKKFIFKISFVLVLENTFALFWRDAFPLKVLSAVQKCLTDDIDSSPEMYRSSHHIQRGGEKFVVYCGS